MLNTGMKAMYANQIGEPNSPGFEGEEERANETRDLEIRQFEIFPPLVAVYMLYV
jgi:hypothetical protein